VHRTADPKWLEVRGDGQRIARISIVRAIWINEPEPRNPDPQVLSITDDMVNAYLTKAERDAP